MQITLRCGKVAATLGNRAKKAKGMTMPKRPNGQSRAVKAVGRTVNPAKNGTDTTATEEIDKTLRKHPVKRSVFLSRLKPLDGNSNEPLRREFAERAADAWGEAVKHLVAIRVVKPIPSHSTGKIEAGQFLDYVVEMYGPPSAVKLRQVVNGNAGFAQDKARIRSYFKAATEAALVSKE